MTDGMPTLPKGWVWATLGEVVVRISNGITQKQNKEKKGLPVTRIETISEGNINLQKVGFLDSVPYEMIEKSKLHPGDILFSNINSDPHLGKTAVFRTDGFLLLHGMNLLLVRAEPRIIMPDFLDYIFHYFRATGVFSRIARHAVNQSSINQTTLKALLVPIPPLAEQQRIIHKMEALLQELTTAKQSLQKVPALVRHFRQSVLAKAFRGELTERDPSDEPAEKLLEITRQERRRKWEEKLRAKGKDPRKYKYSEPEVVDDHNLEKLPEGWKWTSLDSVLEVVQYGTSVKADSPRSKGVPVFRMGNIKEGKLDIADLKYMSPQAEDISKYELKQGDILINRTNSPELVGKCALFDLEGAYLFASYLIRLRAARSVSPMYLTFLMNSRIGRRHIDFVKHQVAGQSNVNTQDIKSMPIPLAPPQEQLRIAQKLQQTFALADQIEKAVWDGLRSSTILEQAILAKAFRGEMVQQDPNDEPASVLLERIRAQRAATGKKGRFQAQLELVSPAKTSS